MGIHILNFTSLFYNVTASVPHSCSHSFKTRTKLPGLTREFLQISACSSIAHATPGQYYLPMWLFLPSPFWGFVCILKDQISSKKFKLCWKVTAEMCQTHNIIHKVTQHPLLSSFLNDIMSILRCKKKNCKQTQDFY